MPREHGNSFGDEGENFRGPKTNKRKESLRDTGALSSQMEVDAAFEKYGLKEPRKKIEEPKTVEQIESETKLPKTVLFPAELSSKDGGSSLTKALAYDVLARVVYAPEGTKIKLKIGRRDIEVDLSDMGLRIFKNDRDGKIFDQLARHFWKDVTTHRSGKNTQYSDADGELAMEFMVRAGVTNDIDKHGRNVFRRNKVNFVEKGGIAEGQFTMDSGKINGVLVRIEETVKENKKYWRVTTVADHHGEGSDAAPSTSGEIYRGLVGLGLLEKKTASDRAVDFLDAVDNGQLPVEIKKGEGRKIFQEQYAKSFYGLERFLNGRSILRFFEDNEGKKRGEAKPTPLTPLSNEQRKRFDFKGFYYSKKAQKDDKLKEVDKQKYIDGVTNKLQEEVDLSIAAIDDLISRGCVLETEKYGRILVDIGGTVPLTGKAARFFDFDGYVGWKPEDNFFQVSTNERMNFDLSEGITVRKLKMGRSGEPLKIELKEIIEKLMDGGGRVGKEMEQYWQNLEGEKVSVDTKPTEENLEQEKELIWYDGIGKDLEMATEPINTKAKPDAIEKQKEEKKAARDRLVKVVDIRSLNENEKAMVHHAGKILRGGKAGGSNNPWPTEGEARDFLKTRLGVGESKKENDIPEFIGVKNDQLLRLRKVANIDELRRIDELIDKLPTDQARKNYAIIFKAAIDCLEDEEKRGTTQGRWGAIYVPLLIGLGVKV